MLTRRRLVQDRRRGLPRRRRPPEDHRPRQGRRPARRRRQRRRAVRAQVRREQAQVLPVHQGGGRVRRRPRPRLRLRQHRHGGGRQLGREAQPHVRQLRRPGAEGAEVLELIRECVEKVNADLAADDKLAGSQISRFLVLHKELDADDGELTRTRKVRRGFIGDRYAVARRGALRAARRSVHRDRGEVRGRPHRPGRRRPEDRRREDLPMARRAA